MTGKGSTPRPFSISQAEYENRWEAIFGRDQRHAPPPVFDLRDIIREAKAALENHQYDAAWHILNRVK